MPSNLTNTLSAALSPAFVSLGFCFQTPTGSLPVDFADGGIGPQTP